MEQNNIKVGILPNIYLKEDGTFDTNKAMLFCGRIGGVCYNKEGFKALENEDEAHTKRRIDITLDGGHHSIYDHVMVNLNLQNVPKMLAMVLNNEGMYTTSEKSARYTPVVRTEDSVITKREEELYNKWKEIFAKEIDKKYGKLFSEIKTKKLAQENARYLVTVFMPTQMIYSASLRQINYLVSWLEDYYVSSLHSNDEFEKKLGRSMVELIDELNRLNLLVPKLMKNEKNRKLSLFGEDLERKKEYFSNIYSTTYEGSFAQLGQAQRHRTLDYQMERKEHKNYYVPPIIADNEELHEEWLNDIKSVSNIYPQGELVIINEIGKYEDFILKCKERLCSSAQLEIMRQTRDTLKAYKQFLEENKNPLSKDILQYSKGARCTFPDYYCNSECGFKEGKILTRTI